MSAKFKQFRKGEKPMEQTTIEKPMKQCPQEVFLVMEEAIVWAVTNTRELAEQFIEREFGDQEFGKSNTEIFAARVYTKLAAMPMTDADDYLPCVNEATEA